MSVELVIVVALLVALVVALAHAALAFYGRLTAARGEEREAYFRQLERLADRLQAPEMAPRVFDVEEAHSKPYVSADDDGEWAAYLAERSAS